MIWQHFGPILTKNCYWAKFHCCKQPNFEKFYPSGHTARKARPDLLLTTGVSLKIQVSVIIGRGTTLKLFSAFFVRPICRAAVTKKKRCQDQSKQHSSEVLVIKAIPGADVKQLLAMVR